MTTLDRVAAFVLGRIVRVGRLELALPDGSRVGHGSGSPEAVLTIRDPVAYRHLALGGVLGFAESYLGGAVDTPDLEQFLRWGAANHEAWASSRIGRALGVVRDAWQRWGPERGHDRVETMVDHYDLGNDFYATWLDPTMTYSSARFVSGSAPTRNGALEAAQLAKYDAVCLHAGLEPGMRVLEIGCGWGGFAEHAASRYGVGVVGLTVSRAQATYAQKRIADAGLGDLVDIRLQDFRLVDGTFDAVVSIEMIESIDETQWPDLFGTIAARLAPHGRAVLQAIVIDDAHYAAYRDRRDFIRRYVFPGGQLPSPRELRNLAASAGLGSDPVDAFGADYALTLAEWRARFRRAWPELATSFDERFRRLWELYLTYCQAGFEAGRIDVQHWVFAHPPPPGRDRTSG